MSFTRLYAVPCLSIDYDAADNCLFMSLQGHVNVSALQGLTLGVRRIRLAYPTRCLVQDDLSPTAMSEEEVEWLVGRLLPALHQKGVDHCAWVCGPTLRSQLLAQQVARRLPPTVLTVFHDLEQAATWLQHTHSKRE